MPRRDGTGPRGNGPLTGRGAGPCKDEKTLESKVDDLNDRLESIEKN